MTPQLQATLAKLPDRPGVYLLKDARGACSTSARRRTCATACAVLAEARPSGYGDGHRIREAIDRVADVEYTMTDSVSEALLLEAT